MKHWTTKANIKQLAKKLSVIIKVRTTNIIAIIVDNILYVLLLFGLTIGLFSVSAGLFLKTRHIQIIPIIILNQIGNVSKLHNTGADIKIKVDETKQIQLLVACRPKEVVLIIL